MGVARLVSGCEVRGVAQTPPGGRRQRPGMVPGARPVPAPGPVPLPPGWGQWIDVALIGGYYGPTAGRDCKKSEQSRGGPGPYDRRLQHDKDPPNVYTSPLAPTVPAPDAPTRRRIPKPAMVGAALLVGGLAAAACGSTLSHSAAPATSPSASAPGTVQISTVAGVGPVLTDSSGRTLYLLSADHQTMATCLASPACAEAWPALELPARTTQPVAGQGVQTSLLSTTPTPDGGRQVTYNHWPLYTFSGDSGPGQDHGQGVHGFGGVWSAITHDGQAATTVAVPPAPSTGSAGGSSGGY